MPCRIAATESARWSRCRARSRPRTAPARAGSAGSAAAAPLTVNGSEAGREHQRHEGEDPGLEGVVEHRHLDDQPLAPARARSAATSSETLAPSDVPPITACVGAEVVEQRDDLLARRPSSSRPAGRPAGRSGRGRAGRGSPRAAPRPASARASGWCIRRGISWPCSSTTQWSPAPYSVYSSRSLPEPLSKKNCPIRSETNMGRNLVAGDRRTGSLGDGDRTAAGTRRLGDLPGHPPALARGLPRRLRLHPGARAGVHRGRLACAAVAARWSSSRTRSPWRSVAPFDHDGVPPRLGDVDRPGPPGRGHARRVLDALIAAGPTAAARRQRHQRARPSGVRALRLRRHRPARAAAPGSEQRIELMVLRRG